MDYQTNKGIMVKDIKSGNNVKGLFLAGGFKVNIYRNKPGQYLVLTLLDLSGTIEAKVWEWPAGKQLPEEGTVLQTQGRAVEYGGSVEIHLSGWEIVDQSAINPSDFLPGSPVPVSEMVAELKTMVAGLANPQLKVLLTAFMGDTKLFEAFCRAPAAKQVHQAYRGGLLEHSLQTARIVSRIAELYPAVDLDLVVAGALLHDLGKVAEYSYDFAIDFTDEGRLLGHIVLGMELLNRLVAQVDNFPERLHLALRHIITSHPRPVRVAVTKETQDN